METQDPGRIEERNENESKPHIFPKKNFTCPSFFGIHDSILGMITYLNFVLYTPILTIRSV